MINFPKFFKEDDPHSTHEILPMLPLRDIVVFPHMVAPLFVGRSKSVNALSDAMNNDKTVFLATQKKAKVDNPTERDINRIGTVASRLRRLPFLLEIRDLWPESIVAVDALRRGRSIRFLEWLERTNRSALFVSTGLLALGLIGGFVGGFILNALNVTAVGQLAGINILGAVIALIGSIILLVLLEFFRRSPQ